MLPAAFCNLNFVAQTARWCLYLPINNGITYDILENLRCCDVHEIIWLKLRRTRLPRGVTCLIVAVVYHPLGSDPQAMLNHLFNNL
jgi:hypothetical protein